jgi:hypothetical protein
MFNKESNMAFRHGQWVKFSVAEDDSVHPNMHIVDTEDGRFGVGIYQVAGTDATGEDYPESVIPVSKTGKNLMFTPDEEDAGQQLLKYDPRSLRNLRRVESREEVPAERLKTMYEGWKPRV